MENVGKVKIYFFGADKTNTRK